ncbi:hypothetical protein PGTUg99_031261 [Puccinia graminis f. sp. tritici]|uniref:Uncharacterized protein n=1 Tax=Puccinia graminis f. sp. tritici TaxID=56615 RepID=A0A5B0MCR4_PUCGR|nr:hypothetical protein PGTUg99_031261 [Puccinia graminis f. sp. tritici]
MYINLFHVHLHAIHTLLSASPFPIPLANTQQITLPESSKNDAPPHGPSTSNTENTGGERESRRTSGPGMIEQQNSNS